MGKVLRLGRHRWRLPVLRQREAGLLRLGVWPRRRPLLQCARRRDRRGRGAGEVRQPRQPVRPHLERLALEQLYDDRDRHLLQRLRARDDEPVHRVVQIGSVLTTALWLRDVLTPSPGAAPTWFTLAVSIWLWFTVLFA